jgi:4a-hydroxytetrahydrobiopterin dehydratase
MLTIQQLLEKKCAHQEAALSAAAIADYLQLTPGWALHDGKLCRSFDFKNYYETMAYVNAIAYVIHAADHHPEMIVTYNRCRVKFDTHSVNAGGGGLSENDFICAAKLDALFEEAYAEA